MVDKQHLTKEGFIKIIYIKSLLNKGLSDELMSTFFPISPDLPTIGGAGLQSPTSDVRTQGKGISKSVKINTDFQIRENNSYLQYNDLGVYFGIEKPVYLP